MRGLNKNLNEIKEAVHQYSIEFCTKPFFEVLAWDKIVNSFNEGEFMKILVLGIFFAISFASASEVTVSTTFAKELTEQERKFEIKNLFLKTMSDTESAFFKKFHQIYNDNAYNGSETGNISKKEIIDEAKKIDLEKSIFISGGNTSMAYGSSFMVLVVSPTGPKMSQAIVKLIISYGVSWYPPHDTTDISITVDNFEF
ncbi:hypothetical protein N9O57_00375 [bacterium]|nr:hypothetical protein [bacterium]